MDRPPAAITTELDRLAEAHGISLSYLTETGEERFPSDDAKRRTLGALGIPAATDAEVAQSLALLEHPRCHLPAWLEEGRGWGITCQLYGLRSDRNLGIGDFEDLAQLAELAAKAGADFIGINPLHALFLADPSRYSPYSPSSRRFLNPLYIAVDRFESWTPPDPAIVDAVRGAELVDYDKVTRVKLAAFEAEYAAFRLHHLGTEAEHDLAFAVFLRNGGAPLEDFALFEALSESFAGQGSACGWHGWPEEYRDKHSDAVQSFKEANEERILFHAWLQWVAQEQLAAAQTRALAAGMRIGLYLDLAVGVAGDGADTWSQPDAVLRGVRIGSPPDAFNANGQDWGLAPLSPRALSTDEGRVFGEILGSALAASGALRIDHVMALARLYLIADGLNSADGAYVQYPFRQMLAATARASQETSAIVIGEDLGTVPPNFRETMRKAGLLGYRVLFFEREWDGRFRLPQNYERDALACMTTHDLPTLRGWWSGSDLDDREAIAMDDPSSLTAHRIQRSADRQLMLAALTETGLLPGSLSGLAPEEPVPPGDLAQDTAIALTRFLARTPCRLVAIQLEDLTGMRDRANLPGTVYEHPNWRRKLAVTLGQLQSASDFKAITQAMAEERPRSDA
jgi:4-alpha-glucanotransferase